jgi:hypothetical protein
MEDNSNVTSTIINTINTILQNLFSSIDNNLYGILDDITFISSDIINESYFDKILGSSASSGILVIANSLLFGFVLYYSIKYLFSHFTYSRVETPSQFVFKCIIFCICINSSYFFIEQILNITSYISLAIRGIGEDLFNKNICFSELILEINNFISINTSSLDIFSLDGIIKATLTMSLLNLVFTYSFRYVMVKIFILLTPFALLSLLLQSTSWFFKSWARNLFSLLFIQIIVSIVLLILFSMDYSSGGLIVKFIYIGAIYSLIKANSFVREFIGGVSTGFPKNVNNIIRKQ